MLPGVQGQTEKAANSQSKLDDLLKERQKMLRKAVDLLTTQHREGGCRIEDVMAARDKLHEAELDAAQSRDERIAVLEKQLQSAEASVSIARQRFQSGSFTEVGLLHARAALLSVKIQLLRERKLAKAKVE